MFKPGDRVILKDVSLPEWEGLTGTVESVGVQGVRIKPSKPRPDGLEFHVFHWPIAQVQFAEPDVMVRRNFEEALAAYRATGVKVEVTVTETTSTTFSL